MSGQWRGGGSKLIYPFIFLFHVLEHLGHFKAIRNKPYNRLGPRICSWPLPPSRNFSQKPKFEKNFNASLRKLTLRLLQDYFITPSNYHRPDQNFDYFKNILRLLMTPSMARLLKERLLNESFEKMSRLLQNLWLLQ